MLNNLEEVLALAKKVAEEAEVFSSTSEETEVQFEANRLKRLETKQTTSIALRVIKDGKTGYALTTQLDNPQALVDSALETAQFDIEARFQFPGKLAYPPVKVYDAYVRQFPTEKMLALGEELIARVVPHTPGIIIEAGVTRWTMTVKIMNTRGGEAEYRKTFFGLGMEGNLIRGTDMLFVGENKTSCHAFADSKEVSDVVIEQLDLARVNAVVQTKSMPVIFTPNGVAGALVMPLVVAFNGKTVLEGASPVGNKLGAKAFSDKFWLWDDPTLNYRPTSRPCDEEGVPSQRTTLIEQGIVKSFFYDLQTAALAKTKSTGNGGRMRGGLPAPAASAFAIAPGNTAYEEMIKGMAEGLVVEQLMGAEMGNVLGGDFSGNVLLGYKVENGRIVGRVKDTMVAGNVYQILNQDIAIGREAKWVGSFVQTPHIYVPSLSVATKG